MNPNELKSIKLNQYQSVLIALNQTYKQSSTLLNMIRIESKLIEVWKHKPQRISMMNQSQPT